MPDAIWNRKVLRLGKNAFIVYVFLLTNEHRHSEGLYRLPLGYVVTDLEPLGITSTDVTAAIGLLSEERLVAYDSAADVVFLPHALHTQPPTSPPQVAGAIKRLYRVPASALWNDFVVAARVNAPELAAEVEKTFHDRMASDGA